jgi:hypothetical protein
MIPRDHEKPGRADPLLTLLLVNGVGGAAVALALVGAMLALDVGRLGTLIAASETPLLALMLLSLGFMITFAGMAIASAIMRIGAEDDLPGDRGIEMIPIRVRSRRQPPR